MNTVRLGIIGMGNIGRHHAEYLLAGKVSRCVLTAVAARPPATLDEYQARGIATFTDGMDLIRSGKVDAVLVATPHYQHTPLGIAALEAGLHLLVEKPISAHKADAERLIAVAQKYPHRVFAGMFQLRAEPRYEKIRGLLREGALGQFVRFNWVITDWYRTDAYYSSSAWRATWQGEGGGVLLNQCLHNLDTVQWLLGMPARVRGFCQLGRFHPIEVEDNVTAYLEWPGGATGVFVSSTGEAPGVNRLEIVGSLGTLILENGRLTFTRNEVDMLEFSRTAKQGFVKPGARTEDVPFENAALPHAAMTQNFVDAILDGTPLIAPGAEGLGSVELANAIVFSSLQGRTLELPMDGAAWESQLAQLSAEPRVAKKVAPVDKSDFAGSFKK